MPQPSRTDRRPRHRCSLPRRRTCMVRYPIILRLSINPSRTSTILPSMVRVPWATFEVASAKDITPNTRKLPSSISDIRNRLGRQTMKVITLTIVCITAWTMRKFRSSSKQMASKHLLTLDITRFNKPMLVSFNIYVQWKSTSSFSDEFTRLLHFLKFIICHVPPEPLYSIFSWQIQHISSRLYEWALELTHSAESDVEIQTRSALPLVFRLSFCSFIQNFSPTFSITKAKIYPTGKTWKAIRRDEKAVRLIS